jgi:hypothetical protein
MVAVSLQRGSNIYFAATCHDIIWAATEVELEQLREYLGASGKTKKEFGFHSHTKEFISKRSKV